MFRIGRVKRAVKSRDVDKLIEMLKDDSYRVRMRATDALGHFKEQKAVLPLIQAFKDPNDSVRLAAVSALGEIGDDRAVEPLIESFYTWRGCWGRGTIIWALKKIGNEKAIDGLAEILEIGRQGSREESVQALKELGGKKVVKSLIHALNDPCVSVQRDVILALGEMRETEALKPLQMLINDKNETEVIVEGSRVYTTVGALARDAISKIKQKQQPYIKD